MLQGMFKDTGKEDMGLKRGLGTFPKRCATRGRHLQPYDLTSATKNCQPARIRWILRKQGQKNKNQLI